MSMHTTDDLPAGCKVKAMIGPNIHLEFPLGVSPGKAYH
jgi:hypothetical protein